MLRTLNYQKHNSNVYLNTPFIYLGTFKTRSTTTTTTNDHYLNFRQTDDDDNDDAQENVTYLSYFVHLPNITQIEFGTNHIELQVYSFDQCVSIIDIFLNLLKNLCYIKIKYYRDTLLDNPYLRDYIIKKRRQQFPNNILHEQIIDVKNNEQTIEIWLS
ncbi:unnamed protein product [Rotaria sp. Silwood1]|nr:unnamed protein product [Rotaria sp. Silwood1]CAF4613862.1 unnamed protein product [Rotaria sp. Silwood1]CAF4689310.1 unnamed protein product [Rotaria sp. Silwood1]CAF4954558.1 unnamed protein product [Rotaria sp. Silwood1]